MAILRYVDPAGREHDVEDVAELQKLIHAGRIGYDSLVWDDEENRWTSARHHEFFQRVAEIVASAPKPVESPKRWWKRRKESNLAMTAAPKSRFRLFKANLDSR